MRERSVMKSRLFSGIAKAAVGFALALVVILLLVQWPGAAGNNSALNVQFIEAAKVGDLPTAMAILEKGADVNGRDEEGETALMEAAFKGHVAVVEFILANGGHVDARDKDGWTATMAAAAKGHLDVVRHLTEKGADISARERALRASALDLAATEGHPDVVKFLLG